jgi:hypothetical protein
MSDYNSIRRTLIWQLEHDSAAHESGCYEDIGRHFDSVAESFDLVKYYVPRGSPESARLNTAMAFWDAWIGSRLDNWQNQSGVAEAQWPLLARRLVADLVADRDVSDPTLKYFSRGDLNR